MSQNIQTHAKTGVVRNPADAVGIVPAVSVGVSVYKPFLNDAIWPWFYNDHYGDCTVAAAAHLAQEWAYVNGSAYVPSNDAVWKMYAGTPDFKIGTDEGRNVKDAVAWMSKHGLDGGHKAFGRKLTNTRANLRAATYLLGGALVTLNLPKSVINQRRWQVTATNNAAGSYANGNGLHCVAVVGYDSDLVYAVTWGQILPFTWAFFDRYVEETWAMLGWDWCPGGTSPHGDSWANLAQSFGI